MCDRLPLLSLLMLLLFGYVWHGFNIVRASIAALSCMLCTFDNLFKIKRTWLYINKYTPSIKCFRQSQRRNTHTCTHIEQQHFEAIENLNYVVNYMNNNILLSLEETRFGFGFVGMFTRVAAEVHSFFKSVG